jgi:hypothetical protein
METITRNTYNNVELDKTNHPGEMAIVFSGQISFGDTMSTAESESFLFPDTANMKSSREADPKNLEQIAKARQNTALFQLSGGRLS